MFFGREIYFRPFFGVRVCVDLGMPMDLPFLTIPWLDWGPLCCFAKKTMDKGGYAPFSPRIYTEKDS